MIGIRSKQGTHLPLSVSSGTSDPKLLELEAWWRKTKQSPMSLDGIPGQIIEGPDVNGLFLFEAPAAGIRTRVPATVLCRHLL